MPIYPRLTVGICPATHGHKDRGEDLPLQVAGIGFRGTAEDTVHIASSGVHGGKAGTRDRRDMVTDIIPVAHLVTAPYRRIPLSSGPTANSPYEASFVRIALDPLECGFTAIQGKLIAFSNPSHIQFTQAGTTFTNLVGDLIHTILCPQARMEASFT